MNGKIIIGIDAGVNGGYAILHPHPLCANVADALNDIQFFAEAMRKLKEYSQKCNIPLEAYVEQVSGYIRCKHAQPASRSFVLGKSYGEVIGILIALEIPFKTVTPQKWQGEILPEVKGLEYNERKRRLREHAYKLYAFLKPTLKIADAILIAEYGRRVSNGA